MADPESSVSPVDVGSSAEAPLLIPVLHIEDDPDLRETVRLFLKCYEDRCSLTEVGSVDAVREALKGSEFQIVLSDLNIKGGESPLNEVVAHLRQRIRAALLVMSGGGSFQFQERMPDSVWNGVLAKPFRVTALWEKMDEMLAFLAMPQEGAVGSGEGEGSPPLEPLPPEVTTFVIPEEGFSTFEALMAALPRDSNRVEAQAMDRNVLFDLVKEGLSALSDAIDTAEDSSSCAELCATVFPLLKRESLLKLMQVTSPASFVLDIAWHDVNNALGGLSDSPEAWTRVQPKLKTILEPAVHAFEVYSSSRDPRVFLDRAPLDVEAWTEGFDHVCVEGLVEGEQVELPRGGARSVLETFVSNALKVARATGQSDHELGVSLKRLEGESGPYLEVVVWDTVAPFRLDQLLILFDQRITRGANTWGMGTGLQRLGHIVEGSWIGRSSIDLTWRMAFSQRNDEVEGSSFYFKMPGGSLVLNDAADLTRMVPEAHRDTARKAFVFRLPLHAREEGDPLVQEEVLGSEVLG